MNDELQLSTVFQVLQKVTTVPAGFAVREKELVSAWQLRLAQAKSLYERRGAVIAQRRDEAIAAARAESAARQQRADELHELDRKRVVRAHRETRRQILEQVAHKEGCARSKLQESLWVQRNTFNASLEKAAAEHEQMDARLSELETRLLALEGECQKLPGPYRRLLKPPAESVPTADAEPDQAAGPALLQTLESGIVTLENAMAGLGQFPTLGLVARASLPALIIGVIVLHGGVFLLLRSVFAPGQLALGVMVSALILIAALGATRLAWQSRAKPFVQPVLETLPEARKTWDLCCRALAAKLERERQRLTDERDRRLGELERELDSIGGKFASERSTGLTETDARRDRLQQRAEALRQHRHETAERDLAAHTEQLTQAAAADVVRLDASYVAEREQRCAQERDEWQQLVAAWKQEAEPLWRAIVSLNESAATQSPAWTASGWAEWVPPATFGPAVQFGRIQVDVAAAAGTVPQDPRLCLPGPAQFALPAVLSFPHSGSLVIETGAQGREQAIEALNDIMLRLLTSLPPGKANFTLIDPVGLGQSFAGFMHLADYQDALVNGKIWTETRQIEQHLADLNEHMEKVIQMYLRNEHATITDYNRTAGEMAERYHFLVVADFPANFNEAAARRLISIATTGARCGVYTLVNWDRRRTLPQDFVPSELCRHSTHLEAERDGFVFPGRNLKGTRLELEVPPGPELATRLLHTVGKASLSSTRVELPFHAVAPSDAECWSMSTAEELRAPIGRAGATRLQYMTLGKGTLQHVLIAGRTGSGKSTLLHVLITNLALWYGPDEVEFYLIDFKKGVEFKTYATLRLPHARAVAVESDREFGLSVLQRVDEELRQRGEMYRKAGVQDLGAYRAGPGKPRLPRTLLIIDEFQEFFVEDDAVSQTAALLLDRIVRQGRAFGIHVLLGSQTLGGAYTLARSTLGQMAVRIALQCSEADSYLILSDDNAAARLLSRPGEAIYNDASGMLEGNSPFQVVWLPDDEKDRQVARIHQVAEARGYKGGETIVFEGNAPADVAQNRPLRALLEQPRPTTAPLSARVWLGDPTAIKGPTEATFSRQNGSHLLMVGQREESALALLLTGIVSLAAQYPRDAARFVVLEGSTAESPYHNAFEQIGRLLPHEVVLVRHRDLPGVFEQLGADLAARKDESGDGAVGPDVYVIVHGLHRFPKLRLDDEYSFSLSADEGPPSPARVFLSLLQDGPTLGLHVLAWCDAVNNVNRMLSRRTLAEFEMRVLFQMSAADSATLIDKPQASTLGLHRALLNNDQEGVTEKFRPYALPDPGWFDDVRNRLA
ncbi:MAG: hypothetical protein A3K19_02460 [Lentisphaerae bacterium RIFOXYB12_FULL_65_16]|nr:MAG: hypothetical protein A3K18_27025 [Lentisphaerae bacterium RIFOXYA12_64_32]OGV85126.1 MAG: hypothetical protein A3K19_02460 [Lentisphaerae bacterium RIFOXYB12_FULL_65_16]